MTDFCEIPPRLSPEEREALRKVDLALLQDKRSGKRPVKDQHELIRLLEDVAFTLADLRESEYESGYKGWWHYADMLDDVMDALDFMKAKSTTW